MKTMTFDGKEYPISDRGEIVLWGFDARGVKSQRYFRAENPHWNWQNVFKRNFLTKEELDAYEIEEAKRIEEIRINEEPLIRPILNDAKSILEDALKRIEDMGVVVDIDDGDFELSYYSDSTHQNYSIKTID